MGRLTGINPIELLISLRNVHALSRTSVISHGNLMRLRTSRFFIKKHRPIRWRCLLFCRVNLTLLSVKFAVSIDFGIDKLWKIFWIVDALDRSTGITDFHQTKRCFAVFRQEYRFIPTVSFRIRPSVDYLAFPLLISLRGIRIGENNIRTVRRDDQLLGPLGIFPVCPSTAQPSALLRIDAWIKETDKHEGPKNINAYGFVKHNSPLWFCFSRWRHNRLNLSIEIFIPWEHRGKGDATNRDEQISWATKKKGKAIRVAEPGLLRWEGKTCWTEGQGMFDTFLTWYEKRLFESS